MTDNTKTKNPILDNMINDYKSLMPIRELTLKYGVTDGYVRALMNINGITRHNVTRIKRRLWEKQDIDYLKNNYGKLHMGEIISHLNRPEISIRVKANMLKLYCVGKPRYNESVIIKHKYDIIIDIYNKIRVECKSLVEAALKISETTKIGPIRLGQILDTRGITRPDRYNENYNKTWTYYEVKRLKELYKTKTTKECAKLMNRSFHAVASKIKGIKIHKTK